MTLIYCYIIMTLMHIFVITRNQFNKSHMSIYQIPLIVSSLFDMKLFDNFKRKLKILELFVKLYSCFNNFF